MKYLSAKEQTKLLALYDGDLKDIFEAFNTSKEGEWYKFINDQALLGLVNPLQSQMVTKVISTINDIIYGKLVIEDGLDKEFLIELETLLQLFGEVLVTWDKIDGEFFPKFYIGGQVDYHETYNGRFMYHTAREYFKTEDFKEYVFEKHYEHVGEGSIQSNSLYLKQGNSLRKVPLSTIPETTGLPEQVKWEHKTSFIFRTDNRLSKIINLVQLIDETLTYMNLSSRISAPTTYVSSDIALQYANGESVDKQYTPAELIKQRIWGVIDVPYVEGQRQSVEMHQPEIKVENYIAIKQQATREILGIIGISESTWGYDDVGERTSADSIREREKLTLRTRERLLLERRDGLMNMFNALGKNFKLDFGNYTDVMNGDNLIKLAVVVEKGFLSEKTFLEQGFPLWSEARVQEELERIKKMKSTNEWMSKEERKAFYENNQGEKDAGSKIDSGSADEE